VKKQIIIKMHGVYVKIIIRWMDNGAQFHADIDRPHHNEPALWSRVLLEKLIAPHPVKKLSVYYVSCRIIAVIVRDFHLSAFCHQF
jgi:hypothetical protein